MNLQPLLKTFEGIGRNLSEIATCFKLPNYVVVSPFPAGLDPFRHTFIRALGHSFAIGEATKYQYSEVGSEILDQVATCYIVSHAIFQAYNASGMKASITALFDSLIFDSLASAIIPCTLTFYILRITAVVLREINPIPSAVVKWGPLVTGVAALAFTYKIIDRCVDQVMNETLRSLY